MLQTSKAVAKNCEQLKTTWTPTKHKKIYSENDFNQFDSPTLACLYESRWMIFSSSNTYFPFESQTTYMCHILIEYGILKTLKEAERRKELKLKFDDFPK